MWGSVEVVKSSLQAFRTLVILLSSSPLLAAYIYYYLYILLNHIELRGPGSHIRPVTSLTVEPLTS